jgi:hypothetical protein
MFRRTDSEKRLWKASKELEEQRSEIEELKKQLAELKGSEDTTTSKSRKKK